jgi:hypothetical protein
MQDYERLDLEKEIGNINRLHERVRDYKITIREELVRDIINRRHYIDEPVTDRAVLGSYDDILDSYEKNLKSLCALQNELTRAKRGLLNGIVSEPSETLNRVKISTF